MRPGFFKKLLISTLVSSCLPASSAFSESANRQQEISAVIDRAIRPVMQEYKIPGMAVAVTINEIGRAHV